MNDQEADGGDPYIFWIISVGWLQVTFSVMMFYNFNLYPQPFASTSTPVTDFPECSFNPAGCKRPPISACRSALALT